MKALLVYSGGMDSTTLLYQMQEEIKTCVFFNYGSKHNHIEKKYAEKNCLKLSKPLITIDLVDVFRNFKSNLLIGGGEIPKGHYADESMKKTVVPFRNGIMLSIAAGLAESANLDTVLLASHFGDHAIYPDCREEFIYPMENAVKTGTWTNVQLLAPYTLLTKREIALSSKYLPDLDYRDTWSCYTGGHTHCGECGTCVERKEALQGFDLTDYLV